MLQVKNISLIDISFHEIVVPTVDTVRHSFIIETLARARKPVLVVGHSGVGKTMTMNSALSRLVSNNVLSVPVTFTSYTPPARCQGVLESVLEKKRKVCIEFFFFFVCLFAAF